MPYIITTTTAQRWSNAPVMTSGTDVRHAITCTAVATIDEAREAAADLIDRYDTHSDRQSARSEWVHHINEAHDLPESGGTLGPLPDGLTIEIRLVNGYDLAGIVANRDGEPCRVFDAVAKFNAS